METITRNSAGRQEKIQETLNKIYNLPALPDIVTEALKLLNSKTTSNHQLIELISKEQSFVVKVLALANSPIYGLRKEVSTLDFAVMVLGYNELRHIVFVISFLESFRGTSSKHFDQNVYWLHSFLTAKVAKRLAEDFGYGKSGEAFVAGFLHDVGVSIIHRYFKNLFVEISDTVLSQEMSFMQAEKEILGMTHAEVGSYLMGRWNLPKALQQSTLNHHNPVAAEDDPMLSAIVHVADYLTCQLHPEKLFWEKGFELDNQVFEILRIKEDQQEQFLEKYSDIVGTEQDLDGILG